MPLTEQQALQVTLVRVLEQSQTNDAAWSTADAKEATRTTKELLGSKASFAEFLARRSQWILETISKRAPDRAIQVRPPRWPLVAGQVLAVFATNFYFRFRLNFSSSRYHFNDVAHLGIFRIYFSWFAAF